MKVRDGVKNYLGATNPWLHFRLSIIFPAGRLLSFVQGQFLLHQWALLVPLLLLGYFWPAPSKICNMAIVVE